MLTQWLRSGGRLETLKDALCDAGLGQTASELHVHITTYEPRQITRQGNERSPMEHDPKWPQPNSEAGDSGNGKCTYITSHFVTKV